MKKEEKGNLNSWRKKLGRMKKAMLLVLSVFVAVAAFAQDKRVWLYNYQPKFEEIFREPFEVLAIYTQDGKTITITNYLEDKVNVTMEEISKYLDIVGSDLASIQIVVHNHLLPSRWSFRDKRFYQKLKEEGFKGQFILYFPWNNSVKYMDELNKGGLDKYLDIGVATSKGN